MAKTPDPIAFVRSCGFTNPVQVPTRNSSRVALAFSFDSFSPEQVRAAFGRHLRFSNDGVFVFRMAPDRAARVCTEQRTVLLVSGKKAVRKLVKVSRQNAQEKA